MQHGIEFQQEMSNVRGRSRDDDCAESMILCKIIHYSMSLITGVGGRTASRTVIITLYNIGDTPHTITDGRHWTKPSI